MSTETSRIRYDAAVAELDAAVEAIKRAPDNVSDAEIDRLEVRFRAAQTEAERCKNVLDRDEELDSAEKRTADPDGTAPAHVLGGGGEVFRSASGRSTRSFKPNERMASRYSGERLNGVAVSEINLGRALRGLVTADWRGADAEYRALAGTSATGGQTLLPTPLSAQFIDLARAASVCVQAGMQTLDLTGLGQGSHHTIAKATADPSAGWYAESAEITPSDPAFGAIEFIARKGVVLTKLSRELFQDAQNADTILEQVLTGALAVAIDAAALEGTGAADDQPLGLANIPTSDGISEILMAADGAVPTNGATGVSGPAKLLEVASAVRQHNATPNALISSPRTWSRYAGLKDANYQPLRLGAGLDELPWYTSTSISDARTQGTGADASNLYAGDFAQLLLGVRQDIDVYVTRDAAITTDELYIIVTWRGDVHPTRAGSFGRLVGILDA